jgi:hypothetical protein
VPCGVKCIRLTEHGPTPTVLEAWPGQTISFKSEQPGVPTVVTFDRPGACALPFGVGLARACNFTESGRYEYSVDGYGAGRGAIVVLPVDWVTLDPPRAVVVYGRGVRLSGRIYLPPNNGEPPPPPFCQMAVLARPAARAETATTVKVAGACGSRSAVTPTYLAWSATLRPIVGTSYVATWRTRSSAPAEIEVRPRVDARLDGRRLAIAVRPARPWRGGHAVLQRLAVDGSWRGVARIALTRRATAIVTVRRRGSPLRAYVPPRFGYVAGWSAPLDA